MEGGVMGRGRVRVRVRVRVVRLIYAAHLNPFECVVFTCVVL